MVNLLRKLRSRIMLRLRPRSGYFLFGSRGRSVRPLSRKFGFDRGTPIDRYYIDAFLRNNAASVRGRCLEVHDNAYTKKFGGDKVAQSDVLDIDLSNRAANLHGDLRHLDGILTATYDCFVLTHTLGLIDDYEAAIRESHRILKPGGTLLFVATVVGSTNPDTDYWRFTPAAVRYVFGKYFSEQNLTIKTYGNVLAGQAHWVGLAAEELTEAELDYYDPHYPILITLRAEKTLEGKGKNL